MRLCTEILADFNLAAREMERHHTWSWDCEHD